MSKIILSELDVARIRKSIGKAKESKSISESETESLLKELDGATVVKSREMPKDIVTMNSVVKITFMKTNKQIELSIVYPDQANTNENKISIFSPIAAALIGYKVGDTIDWIVPSGPTSIRVDEIIYQPEAAGDFDL
jgi:regulator of nucleoside diphosphate kinase